ncbi:MAG: autoinducer binding domain-containing protein [Hyphomicrobiaceae bacterium]|nr:autoinducer binding domain-containing protein [Hyphomicrobiaceae bacterium]
MASDPLADFALDFVDEVTASRDEPSIRDLLLRHCARLGFEFVIVCDLPLPGQTFAVQSCNWPQPLLDRYRERLHAHDPIARHAGRSIEPFVWSEVHWDRSRNSPEQRVIDEAAEFRLDDGFVVPIVGVEGEQSCLSLAGRRSRLQDGDRRALHLMCLYAHHAIRRRRKPDSALAEVALTGAERDCLCYAFMGHEADSIARLTAFNSDEVRRACRRAAFVLGIAGSAEASVRAAVLGEIRP